MSVKKSDVKFKIKNSKGKLKIILESANVDFEIDDAYAVVNWSSNPATKAIMEGIPAFVGPSSLAYDVGNINLKDILRESK